MAHYIGIESSRYPLHLQALLASLNEHQRKVVAFNQGMLTVSGVPGSGKTTTLTALVARLVADGFPPERILAMTFTVAAARVMEQRIAACGVHGAGISTIHSFALQLLKSDGVLLGANRVDDKAVLWVELEKLVGGMRKDKRLPRWCDDTGIFRQFIAYCKARGSVHLANDTYNTNDVLGMHMHLMAKQFVKEQKGSVKAVTGKSDIEDSLERLDQLKPAHLVDVYTAFEARRQGLHLMDFDDMLVWAWVSLMRNPTLRARWQATYDMVFVDEAQDNNALQWDIARLLCGLDSCVLNHSIPVPLSWVVQEDARDRSLVAIADPAQAIYAFRGAAPHLIVEFSKRQDVDNLVLPLNYRSTQGICHASSLLVRGKSWHLTGDMQAAGRYAQQPLDQTLPQVIEFSTPEQEAVQILHWAREWQAGGGALNDLVVLSRTGLALQPVEIECLRQRVCYRKRAAGSFFDMKEVRALLAYIRVACGLDPSNAEFERIVNVPFRYIGTNVLMRCKERSAASGQSMLTILLDESRDMAYPQQRAVEALSSLLRRLNRLAQESVAPAGKPTPGPAGMLSLVLNSTNLMEEVRAKTGIGDDSFKADGIEELRRMASQFQNPVEFVEYCAQLAEAIRSAGKAKIRQSDKSQNDALTLSTIHSYKGLEAEKVWIAGTCSGRHPHVKSTNLDEELRLFYVGLTRGKSQVVVSWYPGTIPGVSPYVSHLTSVKEALTPQQRKAG